MSFLEEAVEGRARVCRGTLEGTRLPQVIGNKEIAEVCFLAIRDPFSLRLPAFVMRVLVVVIAVQAAMDIGATTWAFIASRDVASDFQLGAAVMTNHSSLH
ncbi:MAG TPA: hypothetical protein VN937_20280 [Blastocatellia bacterium]|nr:hypothetical protein [Blastocatellia bacterium]